MRCFLRHIPGQTQRVVTTQLRKGIAGRRTVVVLCLILFAVAGGWMFWGQDYFAARKLESLLAAGEIDRAESMARNLMDDPPNAELCLLVVQSLRMSGDTVAADQVLQQHEALLDSPTRVGNERSLNRARRGQLDGVVSRLPSMLRDPDLDGRDVCEAFAVGFRLNRRFEEAAQLLQAWQRDWPQDYRPHYHEGLMRQTLTEWQPALECYEVALGLDPDADVCHLRMGECLNQLERGKDAIPHFRAVTERKNDNATAWEGLGNALKQAGEFAPARKAFLRVLTLRPENFAARLAIAEIDLGSDDVDSAASIASGLLEIWPEDVTTLYVLSRAEALRGNAVASQKLLERWTAADEAVQKIEADVQVLAKNAADIDLQVSLGTRMLRHYSREMGIQFISAALQISPGHSDARRALEDFQKRSAMISTIPVPESRELL